jgi:chromosome segregation ATPase
MNGVQVAETLRIANGYLPSVKFEYERLKAEVRSLEAEKCNSVRVYQEFTDRIIEMKKRVNELQCTIYRKEDDITALVLQKTNLEESYWNSKIKLTMPPKRTSNLKMYRRRQYLNFLTKFLTCSL